MSAVEKPISLHGLDIFRNQMVDVVDEKDAANLGALFDQDIDFNCGNWDDPDEDGVNSRYVSELDCGSWDNTDYSSFAVNVSGFGDLVSDIQKAGFGVTVTKKAIDSFMSETSTNPVQNKVISAAIKSIRNNFDFDNLINYTGHTFTFVEDADTGVITEVLTVTESGTEFARRVTTPTETGYEVVITCTSFAINTKMTYVKDENGNFVVTIASNS